MSGTANSAVYPFPVNAGTVPKEGSKSVMLSLAWSAIYGTDKAFVHNINLLSQFQTGNFTTPQCVFIDNTTVPYEFILTCTETKQIIHVPRFSQGMYPILTMQAPQFIASLNGVADIAYGFLFTACTTKLFFLNTAQPPWQQSLPDYGDALTQTSSILSLTGTDYQLFAGGGGNAHYLINYLEFTIILNNAFAAQTIVTLQVYETGNSGPYLMWTDYACGNVNQAGILTQRQLSFPTGLLQRDPANSIWFHISSLPAGGAWMTLQANLGIVTIA